LAPYGPGVHVLWNNAGVWGGTHGARLWEHTLEDWQRTVGVNFWGVVHGIRAFLPLMLEQDQEGHVVNTASLAGLISGRGIYGATKHAVVSISESLCTDLRLAGARMGVSVLCPGLVDARIFAASRNRPEELANASPSGEERAQRASPGTCDRRAHDLARWRDDTEAVAEQVLDAVRADRFWILPHGDRYDDALRQRFDGILVRRNPELLVAGLAVFGRPR